MEFNDRRQPTRCSQVRENGQHRTGCGKPVSPNSDVGLCATHHAKFEKQFQGHLKRLREADGPLRERILTTLSGSPKYVARLKAQL